MKKIILLILSISFLSANLKTIKISENFLTKNKDLIIIDIRTTEEWSNTGIVKGSKTIQFFDEKGNYDLKNFITRLNKILPNKNTKFAIICRTGSRTKILGNYLGNTLHYNVINLDGGISKLFREGYISKPWYYKY